MSRLKAKSRPETRRAVFGAAEHIIQTRGLAAATIKQIAMHASVSVGAIYTVFASQEDLVRRVLYAALDDYHDTFVLPLLTTANGSSPIDVAYAIEGLARDHANLGGRNIARLAAVAYTQAYHDAAIKDAIADSERRLEQWFSDICSTYRGSPSDNLTVRNDVRLCADVVRGGRLRVAAYTIQLDQAA